VAHEGAAREGGQGAVLPKRHDDEALQPGFRLSWRHERQVRAAFERRIEDDVVLLHFVGADVGDSGEQIEARIQPPRWRRKETARVLVERQRVLPASIAGLPLSNAALAAFDRACLPASSERNRRRLG